MHVLQIGSAALERSESPSQSWRSRNSLLYAAQTETSQAMMAEIERAKAAGTRSGDFEIQIKGVPVGLGSYVHWDRRLDSRLAAALMSIPGIKGVEIGEGFAAAQKLGSQVHDELFYEHDRGYYRRTNRFGGIGEACPTAK